MKRKSLLIIIPAFAFFLIVLAGVAYAQGEVVPMPTLVPAAVAR